MISIITAIHNQIEFNRLFLKYLEKNTHYPYQLIIIDNHSTDGSYELFQQHGALVVRNEENHCYPDSQNMGMEHAKHDYLVFLNNDIVLAPDWDLHAIEAMRIHGLDVASLGSWESVEDPYLRRSFNQRWKWLRKGKRYLKRDALSVEKLMDNLYPKAGFFAWAEGELQQWKPRVHMGICGSAVITTRSIWDKLGGGWDVEMEAADFDLYARTCQRAINHGDVRPPFIIPWALHHHFSRVTFRGNPESRACTHQHRRVEDKWSLAEQHLYGPQLLNERGWYVRFRKFIKRFRLGNAVIREDVCTKDIQKNG